MEAGDVIAIIFIAFCAGVFVVDYFKTFHSKSS